MQQTQDELSRPVCRSGGCIVCARQFAQLLSETPVDWSRPDDEIAAQCLALPEETRRALAAGTDLSWGCDAEWCDMSGPGMVTIPV
jgi:hypothetical protein